MRKRKTKTTRKPLSAERLGVPVFTGVLRLEFDGREGFYWIASEDPNYQDTLRVSVDPDGNIELSGAVIAADGPFNTAAKADANAKLAVVGKHCAVTEGGTWDPAWDKPQ